jgi:hypothetical protein
MHSGRHISIAVAPSPYSASTKAMSGQQAGSGQRECELADQTLHWLLLCRRAPPRRRLPRWRAGGYAVARLRSATVVRTELMESVSRARKPAGAAVYSTSSLIAGTTTLSTRPACPTFPARPNVAPNLRNYFPNRPRVTQLRSARANQCTTWHPSIPAARHGRHQQAFARAPPTGGVHEPQACERLPSTTDSWAPEPLSSGAIPSAGARPATRARRRGCAGLRAESPRSGSARTAGTPAACLLPPACGRPCGRCTRRRR